MFFVFIQRVLGSRLGNFPVDLLKNLCACVSNCGVDLLSLGPLSVFFGVSFFRFRTPFGSRLRLGGIFVFFGSASPFEVVLSRSLLEATISDI